MLSFPRWIEFGAALQTDKQLFSIKAKKNRNTTSSGNLSCWADQNWPLWSAQKNKLRRHASSWPNGSFSLIPWNHSLGCSAIYAECCLPWSWPHLSTLYECVHTILMKKYFQDSPVKATNWVTVIWSMLDTLWKTGNSVPPTYFLRLLQHMERIINWMNYFPI